MQIPEIAEPHKGDFLVYWLRRLRLQRGRFLFDSHPRPRVVRQPWGLQSRAGHAGGRIPRGVDMSLVDLFHEETQFECTWWGDSMSRSPFTLFGGEGSPKIDYRKKSWYLIILILTSLLKDLDVSCRTFLGFQHSTVLGMFLACLLPHQTSPEFQSDFEEPSGFLGSHTSCVPFECSSRGHSCGRCQGAEGRKVPCGQAV